MMSVGISETKLFMVHAQHILSYQLASAHANANNQ
jgi:hypothetical protein